MKRRNSSPSKNSVGLLHRLEHYSACEQLEKEVMLCKEREEKRLKVKPIQEICGLQKLLAEYQNASERLLVDNRLLKRTLKREKKEIDYCNICQAPVEGNSKDLECGHFFHYECIEELCPICLHLI